MSDVSVSHYDVPTRDKIPVIRRLLGAQRSELALDVGSGTGYASAHVFGGCRVVCVDRHVPNLECCRHAFLAAGLAPPWAVVADATALPFKPGRFHCVLCSEVLEHVADDESVVSELARVVAPHGRIVVTVPYTGLGKGLLEWMGIPTVHDVPGPEYHVRPGYTEARLGGLMERHGLRVEEFRYYLRWFTKMATDVVSLAHLAYQRVVHRRRGWNWADVAEAQGGLAFRCYRWGFPVLWAWSRLDALLGRCRGYGLVALIRTAR